MKLIRLLKENAEIKKENKVLQELYDGKSAQVQRYIKTVASLENRIEGLREDNLRLEGKLAHQANALSFLYRQNADLLLESRSRKPQVKRLTVEEVRTGT